jgi:sec-independent protein translocase protein TatA
MLGNLGFPEILIILVIVLLLFGAKRIPEIAGSMGKESRNSRRTSMTPLGRSIPISSATSRHG